MSGVYFNSLSGMLAASWGLKGISDNVANMQSPGFKGNDIFYQSLGGGAIQYDSLGGNPGNGVAIGGSYTNLKQGDLTHTGVNTHLAMDGEGFFVIQLKSGTYLYTRDGEFHFEKDGYLVDDHSQGYVMGYSSTGSLTRITKNGPATYPGSATTEVYLDGTLYWDVKKPDDTPSIPDPTPPDPDVPNPGPPDPDVPNPTPDPAFINTVQKNRLLTKPETEYKPMVCYVEVFDANGVSHRLEFTFEVDTSEPGTPSGIILKSVTENGNLLYTDFMGDKKISFDASGSPMTSENEFYLDLTFGTLDKQNIRFNFGRQSSSSKNNVEFKQKTEPDNMSNLESKSKDGKAQGNLFDFHFDENGRIIYEYSNENTREGDSLAIARFDDPRAALIVESHNAFRAKTDEGRHLGLANQHMTGRVVGGSLENSNVNSTEAFANIVVLQRMFQACSQIMEVDKQLLEELYKK